MKWYRLYKESDDQADLKKILKQNGITKLPSGTQFKPDRISWSKDGGYAGQKTLDKVCVQLEDAGWKRGEWRTGGVPDGSAVSNSNAYTSPDGKIVMTYSEHYGATAHDNFYGFTFKLTGTGVNESRRLIQRQNKEDNDMKWYRLYREEVEISPEEEKDYKFKFKKGDVVYLPDGKEGTVVGSKILHQKFAGDYYKLYLMYEVLHEVTRLGGKRETVTSWYNVDNVYDNQKDAEKRASDDKEKHDKELKKWLAYHRDEEEDNIHPWGLYGRKGKGGSPNYTGD